MVPTCWPLISNPVNPTPTLMVTPHPSLIWTLGSAGSRATCCHQIPRCLLAFALVPLPVPAGIKDHLPINVPSLPSSLHSMRNSQLVTGGKNAKNIFRISLLRTDPKSIVNMRENGKSRNMFSAVLFAMTMMMIGTDTHYIEICNDRDG